MAEFKKKMCLLGAIGVGKTSLVRQFVSATFSDRYLATVGVKIEAKALRLGPHHLTLVIWDLAGTEEGAGFRVPAYLLGASGFLVVADGTNKQSLAMAQDLLHMAQDLAGAQPHALLLNKVDLSEQWQLASSVETELAAACPIVMKTSAKTGQSVEAAFAALGQTMMQRG